MATGPNPAMAAVRVLNARRVSKPAPAGTAVADHSLLAPILDGLRTGGVSTLPLEGGAIDAYRDAVSSLSPDAMSPSEALAFWINLYNAGALRATGIAFMDGAASAVQVPGAFTTPWVQVDGEPLSLEDIEHGKIRRFGDPRIHAALVCGSASCPTLRFEPFDGARVNDQLNEQIRTFLGSGGASIDRSRSTITFSRIFLWYGRDFTRPDLMPTIGLSQPARLRDTLAWWLGSPDQEYVWTVSPDVKFSSYDWQLTCAVSQPPTTVP
ncbi:MAG: DUF547 domain-containing protein [Acidimicrobiia bacterium]